MLSQRQVTLHEANLTVHSCHYCPDNYDLVGGNQLKLLLSQIPESIDWPAMVELAGTLTGSSGANGIFSDQGGYTVIKDNQCTENGIANNGAGIRVQGAAGHRIESNTSSFNFRGVEVLSAGNVILRNTARGNNGGPHFDIVAGNAAGPIVTVSGVGDISGTPNANHPGANLIY